MQSVEIGIEARVGIKSTDYGLKLGTFSTTPNNMGFFAQVNHQVNINNLSVTNSNPDASFRFFINFKRSTEPIAHRYEQHWVYLMQHLTQMEIFHLMLI